MKRSTAAILGIITFWPIVNCFLFGGVLISMIIRGVSGEEFSGPPRSLMLAFSLQIFTMVILVGLLTFYSVYLLKTNKVAEDKKALWAVIIFLGNIVALPVFSYIYIWTNQSIPPEQNKDLPRVE